MHYSTTAKKTIKRLAQLVFKLRSLFMYVFILITKKSTVKDIASTTEQHKHERLENNQRLISLKDYCIVSIKNIS